ncbi:MAG TPA: hypothetical protein VHP83_22165 [Aggregatilineaceae bacterium]|nr:hypothetical protein [Aggregatilineaceae bacterium]
MCITRLFIGLIIGLMVITGLHNPSEHADQLKITVLTHTPTDDLDPAWSPDGEQIAFVGHHEGNPEVYVLELSSGDLTNLSNSPLDDYDPLWSPDGHYLAFWRRDKQSLNRMVVRDMMTGTEVESSDLLIYPDDYSRREWSSDSHYLAFKAYLDNNWCVLRYGVQSASYQPLTCDLSFSSDKDLSPDAHWLVIYHSYTGFELIDLEAGNRQFFELTSRAFWAPDSQALAYIGSGGLSVNIHNMVSDQISSIDSTPQNYLRLIGWSSTGQLAWFSSSETSIRFYVMEPATQAVQMVADFDSSPARILWSPAGRFIGFNVYESVYVLDTVTGTLYNPIDERGIINDLQWSSDGQYLSAFFKEGEIALIHVGTWTVSTIEDYNNVVNPNFDWSPEGSRLVFSCGEFPLTNLCLVEMP